MLYTLALAVSDTMALTSDVDLDRDASTSDLTDAIINLTRTLTRRIFSGIKVAEPDGKIFVMLGVLGGPLLVWHNRLC